MSRRVGFGGDPAPQKRRNDSLWNRQLTDDEQILWEGRPGFGFKFNASSFKTLALVIIGIGVLGPQILVMEQLDSQMAGGFDLPFFGPISGKLILGVAALWTIAWFFMQTTTTPFFSRYMLSNHRAFIAKTFVWTRIKSYEVTPFRVVEYDGLRNGSIHFATEARRADNGRKRDFPIGFMHIDDAEKVYKMMVEIQRSKVNE